MTRVLWILFCILALPFSIYGCERVGGAPVINPTSTPTAIASSTPTPSPAPCRTPDLTNANLVVIGMASGFAATTDPTYGNIAGYAVIDITGSSSPPNTAMVIKQTTGGQLITPQNTIQFANLEPGASGLVHSAVGFTGNSFPSKPYAFPAPMASPTASLISNSVAWSTGLITAPPQAVCYSQEFSLSPGTYYFGDFNYYNITTFQDVLVVSP
jgi:hypothetical protein